MITLQKRVGLLTASGRRIADDGGDVMVRRRGLVRIDAASLLLLENTALQDGVVVPSDAEASMCVGVCGEDGGWLDAGSGQEFSFGNFTVDGDGTVTAKLALSDDPGQAMSALLGDSMTLAELAAQTVTARFLYIELTLLGSTGVTAVTIDIVPQQEDAAAVPDHDGLEELGQHLRARLLSHAPLRQMLAHGEAVFADAAMRDYPRQMPSVFLSVSAQEGADNMVVRTVSAEVRAVAGTLRQSRQLGAMARARVHGHSFSTDRWSVRGCRCLEQKEQQENGAAVQALSFSLLALETEQVQTVTLAYDSLSLSLPLLSKMPQRKSERLQAQGRTAGGTRYVHDSGTTLRQRIVSLAGLTGDERAALQSFHGTVAASAIAFSFTDEDAEVAQARFADGTLSFAPDPYGLWQTELRLDLEEASS